MLRRLLLVAAAVAVIGQSAWDGGRHVAHAWSQSPERMATPDIEVLVKQAVEDRFAAKDVPDGNLLGKATRIAIREEMPEAGLKLGRAAVPQRDGYSFVLISGAAAQAEADRSGRPVYFITVDQPSISGDTATVSLGVDVVSPREPKTINMCCCTGQGQFRRAGGRWAFVKWAQMICS
jgi:hypothetical protein